MKKEIVTIANMWEDATMPYRHYQETDNIASMCCDNDNVRVIVLERIITTNENVMTPKEIMNMYARCNKAKVWETSRKHSWVFVEKDSNGELNTCLWAYDNKTQFWILGDKIIVFEMLEEKK